MIKRILHGILMIALLAGLLAVTPATPVAAATLTVDNLTDGNDGSCADGDCSLREAVADADPGDTITFNVTGTIVLGSQILISKNLTITGPGSAQLTVSGNNLVRVFEINTGTVSISGLSVVNGKVVQANGGGINVWSNLTLDDVNVINNIAENSNPNFPYEKGGGIYVHDSGTLTMSNGSVSGNTATQLGGGIYSGANASISLENVIIENNNLTHEYGTGGGLSVSLGSTVNLNRISIQNNNAIYGGGGLYARSSITMTNSSITNNTANDSATSSGYGGGLYLSGTATNYTLDNVTISGNSVSNSVNNASGGGIILVETATLNLNNVTISNNTSQGDGAGIFKMNTATLNIGNSILAGNTASNSTTEDCSGTINSLGYNLIQVTTGCTIGGTTTGNVTGLAAELAPLGNYGGSTLTHALFSNSPALDSADNATCESADQIGTSRPQDGNNDTTATCDMGAFEHKYETKAPTVVSITRASATPTSAASVDFTVTFSEAVQNVDASDFSLTTSGVSGTSITNVTGSGSTRTVTVNTGTGNGTIRLDIPNSATIKDLNNNDLTGLPYTSGEVYTISKLPTSPTFGDVPMSHPYWEDIEILYANGFTAGCSASPLLFCPEATMNRGESAVFMLRGNFGSSYVPPNPPYSPIFVDNWASGPWAQKWAQGMLAEGLTAGCSTSPLLYCPWEQMPRLQAAVFGMRLKEGNAYNPPAATGTVFADITDPSLWYAKWAEAAYNSGILPACGTQGGKPLFCPNQLVSRGLGAYMIVRAKNLSMP